jgi:hypothetical protein
MIGNYYYWMASADQVLESKNCQAAKQGKTLMIDNLVTDEVSVLFKEMTES